MSGLRRELRVWDSTMLVMGSMIGSGIFIVSADMARVLGSPGWLLAAWALTGLVTVGAALSYGELACMMPQAGGQYVYLREAYGPLAGFLFGWTLFLVIQTGTIAAVAVAFAKFTGVLLPWFSESHVLLRLGGFKVSAAQLLAIGVIALLTGVNLRGLRQGRLVQNAFTVVKVLSLGGLILLGLTFGRDPAAVSANLAGFWETPKAGLAILPALGAAMVGSLFSSIAWEYATFTAGEAVDPQRTVPLSLTIGTMGVTALYLLATVSYLCLLPLPAIQGAPNDRVATAALSAVFGPAGALAMAVLIMVSTFGCNNGVILSGARVFYAMAQDGLFFKKAGALNEAGVPGAALLMQGLWAGLLCLSGTYGDLLDYVVFAILLFYALTVAAVFVLRRRKPDAPRPYRVWGYPFVPGLYILLASAICVDLLVLKPLYTWPGIGIVLLGVPVYYAWRGAR